MAINLTAFQKLGRRAMLPPNLQGTSCAAAKSPRTRFAKKGPASLIFRPIALLLVAFLASLAPAPYAAAAPQTYAPDPPSRSFAFSYVVKVKPPANSHKVRAWIPLPTTDDFQTISELQLQAPAGIRIHEDSESGGRYAYFTTDSSRIKDPFEVRLTFHVVRYERNLNLMPVSDVQGSLPSDVTPFLLADKWAPIDGAVETLSQQQAEGISDPLQKARKLFEYVVSAAPYDDVAASGKRNDAVGACDSHSDCTGFNSLFISLARAAGIPARLEIGFSLPEGQREGTISGYHCWAEFYINGIGWIPLDASKARQYPEKRGDFFGAIDARRVMISNGRDVPFAPELNAGSLNYLVDPYIEIDGKPYAAYSADFFFQEGGFDGPASKKTVYARSFLSGGLRALHFPS